MLISLTYLKLKSPLKFFAFAKHVSQIAKQIKNDPNCVSYKLKGGLMKHYTMSMWNNEEDMMAFVRSEAHTNSMKESKKLAAELLFKRIEGTQLPSWKEAAQHLHSK